MPLVESPSKLGAGRLRATALSLSTLSLRAFSDGNDGPATSSAIVFLRAQSLGSAYDDQETATHSSCTPLL